MSGQYSIQNPSDSGLIVDTYTDQTIGGRKKFVGEYTEIKELRITDKILINGDAYESQFNIVKSTNDMLILREDASSKIPDPPTGVSGRNYSGFLVNKYDGTDSQCAIVVDNTGTARLGKVVYIDVPIYGISANLNPNSTYYTNIACTIEYTKPTNRPYFISYSGVSVNRGTYSPVADPTGKNPAVEGWYELVSGQYLPTSDIKPAPGKTYYIADQTYCYFCYIQQSDNTRAFVTRNNDNEMASGYLTFWDGSDGIRSIKTTDNAVTTYKSKNLSIDGPANTEVFKVTDGNSVLGGTLTVNGSTAMKGNLSVNSKFNINADTGHADVFGDLVVSGLTSISGTLKVNSSITATSDISTDTQLKLKSENINDVYAIIKNSATDTSYTHTLPAATGILLNTGTTSANITTVSTSSSTAGSTKVGLIVNSNNYNFTITPTYYTGVAIATISTSKPNPEDPSNPITGTVKVQIPYASNDQFGLVRAISAESISGYEPCLIYNTDGRVYSKWSTFGKGVNGLVPGPNDSELGLFLRGDGTWTSVSAEGLAYSGPKVGIVSAAQTDESYYGSDSGWASYLIFNHGDGATYYHQMLRMPFQSIPQYQRLVNGGLSGWKDFITSENIENQYVAGLTSAINKEVSAGYIHRQVIETSYIEGYGWIARAAIGQLRDDSQNWGKLLLSVGTNNAGTTWYDYSFDANGNFSGKAATAGSADSATTAGYATSAGSTKRVYTNSHDTIYLIQNYNGSVNRFLLSERDDSGNSWGIEVAYADTAGSATTAGSADTAGYATSAGSTGRVYTNSHNTIYLTQNFNSPTNRYRLAEADDISNSWGIEVAYADVAGSCDGVLITPLPGGDVSYNSNYRVLFEGYADDTEHYGRPYKTANFSFNPYSGNLNVTSLTAISARSKKKCIKKFEQSGLSLINSTEICQFKYKKGYGDGKTIHVGFIADDTNELLAPNHDSMDYTNCIGVLMKAVQELSAKVKELEEKLNER